MQTSTVSSIREYFNLALRSEDFVIDKTGVKTLELAGAQFIADEPSIFGTMNTDYVARELEWYKSQSLSVHDIPGGAPEIWKQVADQHGYINSNYGWCIYSQENGNQYDNALKELQQNPNSRRAVMIYTRPFMHYDYKFLGMNDFICTNTVQYLIRNERLHTIVNMRSNDVWAGYRNDFAWQQYVALHLCDDLALQLGNIVWNVGSLHLYSRNFYLLDHYSKTGESTITKEYYKRLYPNSQFA